MINFHRSTQRQNGTIQIVDKIVNKFAKLLMDMSLIVPLTQLMDALFFENWANSNTITSKVTAKLSPLARERLREKEVKVREIARRAGITHPERIAVCVEPFETGYSISRNMLFIPPTELVKKEDLPTDIQIENYHEKNLGDNVEFVRKLSPWLAEEFLACKEFKNDIHHYFLKTLKSGIVREKMFLAFIGHELGHYFYNHTKKAKLVRLVLRLLSLPTLGLTSLLEERLIQKLKRRQEKEADLFSAKKLGGAEGLIAGFSQHLELHQMLYKGLPGFFTHIYDNKGNSRKVTTHPPLTRRIAYLKPFLSFRS